MSASWKNTLKLPRSSFPARPNPQSQKQFLLECTDNFYQWQSNNKPQENPFVLHDGPPYANGPLHIGHSMNKVLKDMILRWQVQRGRGVVYRPSWDCHGLPIEMKALKSKNAKTLSPAEVRTTARRLAAKTIDQQMVSFKTYGIMADWDNKWTTMDKEYEIRQLRVFQRMVRRRLIFRRHKPVYWSISSVTALAEAELDYREDHVSTAAYVKFPIVSDLTTIPSLSGLEGPLYAAIWTTTPWTLPANKAIGVHDEMLYSVLRVGTYNLLVAQSRVEALRGFLPDADIVADSILGSELRGLEYRNKLQGKASSRQPIIHADFVTADSGSGLVHLAPGHGQVDYEACSALGIEAFAPITDEGIFTSEAYPDDPEKLTSAPSILTGGSKAVLELVGDDVLYTHKLRHKYPYDWRTKEPVIIRATAQWFADVGSIKDDAIEALKDVRFVPESGRSRLESFVKGRSEWCISRQRSWGMPIPALYDESGNAVMSDESIEHIISVIQERGLEAWFTDSPDEPAWIPPFLEGKYRRGTDTMDVWFDSGSSWAEMDRPADVYLEGSDQHRGWFQSSLLTYIATQGSGTESGKKATPPFKALITHGFVLDSEGKKMSKSIGNTISPESVMDGSLLGAMPSKKQKDKNAKPQYDALGPDVLRLWVASSDFTADVQIGQSVLLPVRAALIKYRSILKMIIGSLHPQDSTTPITKLDEIAMVQLEDTMKQVAQAYDNQEFHRAISVINQWVATDLSSFYLEALKDRLYCGDGGGILMAIYTGFLRMLAPVTPLLVEDAWHHRPSWLGVSQGTSINPARQLFDEPLLPDRQIDRDQIRKDIPTLSTVHSAIKAALERARVEKVLGSSLQCSIVVTINDTKVLEVLTRYLDELDAMFVVSSVDLNQDVSDTQPWKYVEPFDIQGERGEVFILPPKHAKCPRCWRYLAAEEDSLCNRCDEHRSP